jgi:Holliday junction resolvase
MQWVECIEGMLFIVTPKYNKTKGAKFETDVMKWFRKMGLVAERLRLSGGEDEGDLVVIVAGETYIFELKNTKKLNLKEFWDEAQKEAANYAKHRGINQPLSYVLFKRRSAGIEKAWVIQDLTQWLKEKQ